MTTYTGYPDAHAETSTVDGYVRSGLTAGTVWSTLRTTGQGASDTDAATRGPWITCHASGTDTFTRLYRSILGFDTSAIPAGATISSATLTLYGTGKAVTSFTSTDAGWDLCVCNCSAPATPTALVTGDFSKPGTTIRGSITYASWSAAGNNVIALDAAAVNKGGLTWLALEFRCDAANTAPTWIASANIEYSLRYADYGSTKPTLTVEYTTAGITTKAMFYARMRQA